MSHQQLTQLAQQALRQKICNMPLHIQRHYKTRLDAELEHIAQQQLAQQALNAAASNRQLRHPMLWGWVFDLSDDPVELSAPIPLKGALDAPDIDIDFSDNSMPESAMRQVCGNEHVFHVATFSTFNVKGSIRDICRTLAIPINVADKLSEPFADASSIDDLDDIINRCTGESYIYWSKYRKKLVPLIQGLNGMTRHVGQHSAGRVFLPGEYTDLPLIVAGDVDSDDKIIAVGLPEGTSSRYLGELGYVKFDFLGLKTLRLLQQVAQDTETVEYVASSPFYESIFQDRNLFEALSEGDTDNVFQFSSEGMKDVLRQVRPENLEDLAACAALYRPGSKDFIPEYVANKNDPYGFDWICPELKPILGNTHAVIVYQEQISEVFIKIGGFTPEEAEGVRKILKIVTSANPTQDYLDKWEKTKKKFVDNSPLDKEVAQQVLEMIEHYAGYSFNKSHSVSYAMLALKTMFFKVYYPLHFNAALIATAEQERTKGGKGKALRECPSHIEILPPCIYSSGRYAKIERKAIRLGLSFISGVQDKDIDTIIVWRDKDDRSLPELLNSVNKKSATALVLSNSCHDVPKKFDDLKEILATTKHYKKQDKLDELQKSSAFQRDLEYFEALVWSNPFTKLRESGKFVLPSELDCTQDFKTTTIVAAIYAVTKRKLTRGPNSGNTFYICHFGDDRTTVDVALFKTPEQPPQVGKFVIARVTRRNGRNTAEVVDYVH